MEFPLAVTVVQGTARLPMAAGVACPQLLLPLVPVLELGVLQQCYLLRRVPTLGLL